MKTNISNEQRAAKVLADARWAAVVGRDSNADGRFFYSVRTTGVYCRPSCPSRTARPENVSFYATAADAEEQLGDAVSVYLDAGRCSADAPSTIVDLTGSVPRLLRAGAVSVGRLREVAALSTGGDAELG